MVSKRAIEYLLKAIDQKDSDAMVDLGIIYMGKEEGIEIDKIVDYRKAFKYFKMASDL